MKKVLYTIMFGGDCYPFTDLAHEIVTVRKVEDIVERDAVMVVWGGADINPALYGHKQSRTTHCYDSRDKIEWESMKRAVELGIPIIGVCRGAQMACALAGGFLIQDTSNHAGYGHTVDTYDGSVIKVNSIHHQMMAGLEYVEHELLAWSSKNISGHYTWKDDIKYVVPDGFKEPEMVYFPKIKAYAVQWHPEGMAEDCLATEFIFKEYHARETATV